MIKKINYYIILNRSPWPIILILGSLNLFLGLSLTIKFIRKILILNLIVLTVCCFIWWIDYSTELNKYGQDLKNLREISKNSIILFIISEVILFFSLFWRYFRFFLSPIIEIGETWPPNIIEIFDWIIIPMINTIILLLSRVTLTIRHHNLFEIKNYKSFNKNLITTIILGITFTLLQSLEYKESFFSLNDSRFGRTFYILTGLHGSHVIIGSIFLTAVLIHLSQINPRIINYIRIELASWYWHFVDLVWIFVYYFLYYLNK